MQRPKRSTKRTIGSIRPLVILGIALILWWLLPPFIKSGARQALKELQAPLWTGVGVLHNLDLYWSLKTESKETLIESIRDLARENAALRLELQKNEKQAVELRRMEAILRLPEVPGFQYRVARVYRRDTTAWWDRMIIGLGLSDGLSEGLGVVSAHGVVGRVVEVGHATATVELASSPLFRMAVAFNGDPRPVTYQGRVNAPFDVPMGGVYNVPTDFHAAPWDPLRLVSSHLGGVFPGGLTLGWVRELEVESDGLFQHGEVYLPESLLDLSEVAVLIPVFPNQEEALYFE